MVREAMERRIGAVAAMSGLSVRALRHYDEIGLLSPSERTEAGHRVYGSADIERLYRILALRSLGLGLEDVRAALESEDPRDLVARHLSEVERQLELAERLRSTLRQLLFHLDRADEPSTGDIVEALEVMKNMENYYTPEQLADLEKRREALGEHGMEAAQQQWADLIADAEAEMNAGTDPAEPKVQSLVDRWQTLIEQFTGGDAGIRASLQKMHDEQGPEQASRGMVNPKVMEFMSRAMAARSS